MKLSQRRRVDLQRQPLLLLLTVFGMALMCCGFIPIQLGTHTNGSTVVTVQGYNSIQSLVEYEATAAKVDTFIDGTMLEEDREKFAKSELPNALEAILTSRFPPDLIEGGFAFIKKSIEVPLSPTLPFHCEC